LRYGDVSESRNGGQAGVGGTLILEDFVSTLLVYGGGGGNRMSVDGRADHTINRFAGAAVKASYALRPSENFSVRPELTANWCTFGGQSWNSGEIAMKTNSLSGLGVTAGVKLTYGKRSWNVNLSARCIYNKNNGLRGAATVASDEIPLPEIKIRRTCAEFSAGAGKTFDSSLTVSASVNIVGGNPGFSLNVVKRF
jgi:hypothetical protein